MASFPIVGLFVLCGFCWYRSVCSVILKQTRTHTHTHCKICRRQTYLELNSFEAKTITVYIYIFRFLHCYTIIYSFSANNMDCPVHVSVRPFHVPVCRSTCLVWSFHGLSTACPHFVTNVADCSMAKHSTCTPKVLLWLAVLPI